MLIRRADQQKSCMTLTTSSLNSGIYGVVPYLEKCRILSISRTPYDRSCQLGFFFRCTSFAHTGLGVEGFDTVGAVIIRIGCWAIFKQLYTYKKLQKLCMYE